MKSTVLATLLASAAAFAPAAQKTSQTALSLDFSNEPGALKPLGFWDPWNVLEDATQERFDSLRETEIKHGRVCMLAVTGYLTTAAGIRFPGCESFPGGFAAFPAILAEGSNGKNVLLQMLAFFAVAEIINRDAVGKAEFVGDYRNGYLDYGWDRFDEETKLKKRNIEINNGRAAMMGITALMWHEYIGVSILPGGSLGQ